MTEGHETLCIGLAVAGHYARRATADEACILVPHAELIAAAARVAGAALASGRTRAVCLWASAPPLAEREVILVTCTAAGEVIVFSGSCRHEPAGPVNVAEFLAPGTGALFFRAPPEGAGRIARQALDAYLVTAIEAGKVWAQASPPADALAWSLYCGRFRRVPSAKFLLADYLEEQGYPGVGAVRALIAEGANPAPAMVRYTHAE